MELAVKYPLLATEARQKAIEGLKDRLSQSDNVVLKARLARLILDENPLEARHLLEEVVSALPNLRRPWIYLGYLYGKEGNPRKADQYFRSGMFLWKKDFVSNYYYGRYCLSHGLDEKAVGLLKNALRYYGLEIARRNKVTRTKQNMDLVPLSHILPDLWYYIQPQLDASAIFTNLGNYYGDRGYLEIRDHYFGLSGKYENRLYKGGEDLP